MLKKGQFKNDDHDDFNDCLYNQVDDNDLDDFDDYYRINEMHKEYEILKVADHDS